MVHMYYIYIYIYTSGTRRTYAPCLAKALKNSLKHLGDRAKGLECFEGRLHYELIEGQGPSRGWVTISLKDKDDAAIVILRFKL